MHTVEVKEVGESVGQHGTLAASHAVAQELLWIFAKRFTSLRATNSDVDGSLTAAQCGWVQSCIITFYCFFKPFSQYFIRYPHSDNELFFKLTDLKKVNRENTKGKSVTLQSYNCYCIAFPTFLPTFTYITVH